MALVDPCGKCGRWPCQCASSWQDDVIKQTYHISGNIKHCGNCDYHGLNGVTPCHVCSRSATLRDCWVQRRPEKSVNLTWWEADKLWHDGWLVVRSGLSALDFDWDSAEWDVEDIRATDWCVKGRRNKE